MRRKAYIEHKGLSLGINTLFLSQKDFTISDITPGDKIDLISLTIAHRGDQKPEFYVKSVPSYYSDAHRDDPDGTVFQIKGIVDSHGNKEVIGYIGRGESEEFNCYIP